MECPFEDRSLPEEVRESLLDFAVGHVLEVPGDLDAFGLRHFIEAYAYRQSKKAAAEDESKRSLTDESAADLPSQPASRRDGIFFAVEPAGDNHVERKVQMPPGRKLKTKLHLKKMFPFKYLDDTLVDKAIDRMIRVSVRAGDTIVRQGDTVLNFFVIESGVYEERVKSGGADVLLYEYNSWGCFQLASLVSPNVAQSTFVALTDGVLWAISCTEFRAVASSHDKALLTAKITCLQHLPYISDLPSSDRNKLVDGVDFLRFKKGEFIIKGTAESNGLYKVISGKVTLRRNSNSRPGPKDGTPETGPVHAQTLGRGETFGDLTMFCRRLSGTRAVAEEPCEVLRLSALAFERLLGPFNKYFVAGSVWKQEMAKMECGHWDWLPLHGELADLMAEYKMKKPEDFLKFGWEYYRNKSSLRFQAAQRSNCQQSVGKVQELQDIQNTKSLQPLHVQMPRSIQTAQSRQTLIARKLPIRKLEPIQEGEELSSSENRPPSWNHPLQLHVQRLQNRAVPPTCHERGDCLPELVHSAPESALSLDNLTYTISEDTPSKSQLKKLRQVLKSVPILKALGDRGIDETIKAMQLVRVFTGHYVMKSQKPGSLFYVIEEGSFKTFISGIGVTHEILDCPEHFGELGLIMDVPRFADIVAATDGKVWALSRQSFRKIADSVPIGKRGLNYKLVKNIGGLELLTDFDIKALSLTLETTTYKDREILCSFGDESACVFFVKQGTVRVYSRSIKNKSVIIKKGESFGCLKFSVGKSEELKAQSIGRSKVARLPVSSFEKLLSHCRQVLYRNKCLPST